MTRREITPLDIKRIRGVMCLTQLKYHVNTYAFDDCVRELNVVVDELRNHVGVN